MHYLYQLGRDSFCPCDKVLNTFKWLFLDPCNRLHCQCFHFNQQYLALLRSPGHTNLAAMISAFCFFWDRAQEQPQFTPKSLLASFSSAEEREIAFNGNFEKALQHLGL